MYCEIKINVLSNKFVSLDSLVIIILVIKIMVFQHVYSTFAVELTLQCTSRLLALKTDHVMT